MQNIYYLHDKDLIFCTKQLIKKIRLDQMNCKGCTVPKNLWLAFLGVHNAYSWNNKCQKCVGMGLNGFLSEKINRK